LLGVQAQLAANQIITSVATPNAAIGFAEASRLFTNLSGGFYGQPIDSTTVLLLQTLRGDANLDRSVSFADLLALAENYGVASGKTWADGDFTYDGAVGFSDLLALAESYGTSILSDDQVVQLSSDFAADWALAQSLVPEPALAGLVGAFSVVGRRRRA
jgi:hypothetical protein